MSVLDVTCFLVLHLLKKRKLTRSPILEVISKLERLLAVSSFDQSINKPTQQ